MKAKKRIDHVVQIGDLYDCMAQSRFPKSMNYMTPAQEIESARNLAETFWETVYDICPKASLWQLLGNHDIRPKKRIRDLAPELEHFMEFHEYWRFDGVNTQVDDRDELLIDDIAYIHGHRSKLGDHARFMLRNVVCGHTHRGGTHFINLHDKIIWELNCGFVGDRNYDEAFSYIPHKKFGNWTTGMGEIDNLGPRFIPL